MDKERIHNIESELSHSIEKLLPEFKKLIDIAINSNVEKVLIHQDAFAVNYNLDEFVLLGKAIKYAGIHGITIMFHGKNRETLTK
jgi:hypothetical protein